MLKLLLLYPSLYFFQFIADNSSSVSKNDITEGIYVYYRSLSAIRMRESEWGFRLACQPRIITQALEPLTMHPDERAEPSHT